MEEVRRSRFGVKHPGIAASVDWFGVFVATTSFVYIALWAASPDSANITLEEAIWRSLSYSIPITLGMWGITRATRRGSAVPSRMAQAMPYARLGADGKPESVTWKDNTPTPLGKAATSEDNEASG